MKIFTFKDIKNYLKIVYLSYAIKLNSWGIYSRIPIITKHLRIISYLYKFGLMHGVECEHDSFLILLSSSV